ncbi:carotenoid oxygenase family protein [Actinomadura livida]|uniref:Dioxygenase n=1 Tax=Actinomadura livida TaxID=79909 RepID=A0A7W7MX12_9ACTN|nr:MULTISPECIES: carotenoid oxygenase family protein [Actinomadura]MBB4774173.1 carotenoid cleavage dioxygenase [Actinomadura catellatispora]GGT84353.1 dioxygenase [Actinomadura livida]
MANPYLQGLLAPVTEEVTAHDLPVTGRIPSGLRGRYLRIGPNPLGPEDESSYHWFLGDGMVHGVRLRDGRAEWYRNRWVRSMKVAEGLQEPWPAGPVVEGFDLAPNTHVIAHAGDTLALVEAGARPYRLDYELNTLGPCDFGGTLKGGYTAHPKEDPETGELHAIGYYFGWEHLEYTVRGTNGEIVRSVEIPVQDSPMVHDFALTQKYVVVYDLPITFSMALAEAGAGLPYEWNDAHQARVGLLPRGGGADDVRWIDIPPCWVFHTLNAYDDGDDVIVDLARFPSFMHGGRLEGNPPPVLDRWTIDPAAGKVVQETVDDRPQEFPRMDERLSTHRHRYGYTVTAGVVVQDKVGEALMKHDYRSGTSETRLFPAGSGVGEAVFVPAAPDSAEDDGYLMTLVFDPVRQGTDLVIIASQDFTGEPVATVHLPVRVPLGFHGSWAPDLR